MKKIRKFLSSLTILFALLIFLYREPRPFIVASAEALPPARFSILVSESSLYRIWFENPGRLSLLTSRLDVWLVDHRLGFALASIRPVEYNWLVAAGYRLESITLQQSAPEFIPGFSCYRTIEELYADMEKISQRYPEIVQIRSIGSSYEGRPLRVIRLTNRQVKGDKPVLFLMANIHGRELITPEVAMAFLKRFVQGYGVNADITWLLDYEEIHILVSANPDGHVKNETGEPWASWRKNTHPYGSCPAELYGVDLNRNFDFGWDRLNGASDDACDEVYRGPSAASEQETLAIQSYFRELFPDKRGPKLEDKAPGDTKGMLISLHSFGNLVLWPWGMIPNPAPNDPELARLAKKLAAFNGYNPIQSNQFYTTTGTADEWIYGVLGVPAFTFEIGEYDPYDPNSSFYPSCDRHPELIEPNLQALIYAARVARAPYRLPKGPDITELSVTTVYPDGGLVLQATAGNLDSGTIAEVELTIDLPPWDGGTPVSMTPVDGVYDSVQELAQAALSLTDEDRRFTFFVHARDISGAWGPVSAIFYKSPKFTFLPAILYNGTP